MNGKKILIINYEFPPLGGGGGVAANDLAKEWVKTNKVDVLTSSFSSLPRHEVVDGIGVYRVKIWFRKSRDVATFVSMLSYIINGIFTGILLVSKNKYDVINTHFAVPSGPLGYIISKIFRIPNLLFIHGGDIYDPSKKMSPHDHWFFKRVVRFILNTADRIVCQSSNTRDNAVNYYSPKKDITIIPLPFHVPVFVKKTRKELDLRSDEFLIITVGRLIKRKAYDTAIRAIAELKSSNVRLLIIGDGPEKEFLQSVAHECGVTEKISFLGYCDDDSKFKYLSASDLFLMTSLHEGFGIVYMEAMYCGLPIVSANNGGQNDFLKHGEHALLFNVGDHKKCAYYISEFINNKDLYKSCGINNVKTVQTFYADKIAEIFLKIFDEMIMRKS